MITLTTDFGDSAYAGAVRGVLLARAPGARLVDVTHAVPGGDVTAGALALLASVPHFPRELHAERDRDGDRDRGRVVHLAVVDPGVGTARRAVALRCRGAFLVGPDNGLLAPVAKALGVESVRVIAEARLWNEPVSPVFHARDVFAPIAAHLHEGGALEDVGPAADPTSLVPLALVEARPDGSGVAGRVLAVDGFGNVTTSIPEAAARRLRAAEKVTVEAGGARLLLPFCRAYGEVPRGRPLVLVGSAGFVELAVNGGSAAQRLALAPGDEVRLSP